MSTRDNIRESLKKSGFLKELVTGKADISSTPYTAPVSREEHQQQVKHVEMQRKKKKLGILHTYFSGGGRGSKGGGGW